MPVIIPDTLPAATALRAASVCTIRDSDSKHQDIRPMRVAILNIMPRKIATETLWLSLLGNSALQVEITLLRTESYTGSHTPLEHLETFYKTFSDIEHEYFDGLIITGAPVEHLDFETVHYWEELSRVLLWSKTHVFSTLHVCWGAMAGLYYHYGVPKVLFEQKLFGVFSHTVADTAHPLVQGFDDRFKVPHSRTAGINASDITKAEGLSIIVTSDDAGVHLVATKDARQVFILGHPEYDRHSLQREYERDKAKGLQIPRHYFPNDNPLERPLQQWHGHASLFMLNWLHHIYGTVPYQWGE
jgi:homoserine O-succinyltransferase